jgi:hypothetical protein
MKGNALTQFLTQGIKWVSVAPGKESPSRASISPFLIQGFGPIHGTPLAVLRRIFSNWDIQAS